MKRVLLSMTLIAALPLMAAACGMGEQTPDGYENAPISHVHEHVVMGEASPIPFILLDVRTPEEYAEGHIQGAILIPLQVLAERLAEVPKDKQVYVYCHSGRRSAMASKLLTEHGYTRIENVMGGITAWKDAGYEVVKS
ncbi:MAG: rhodanese-like domain-containing protein [Zetaproteobacteria bacterium CG12_big_fil_rev_8_21_14_0_65_55_1124]|nr:MAG: hydrolase [Zetaproteobacteria bacterium CG1_02_55_237]PIS20339.1 MAG: rhodanese-like domain-containing protein [Zetaproteobacteria bacterium CG08_land_8_20_14_0_20_55_17]PIW42436.1 MAG: rhodanese-like domain-containing protein [Zetaproteobacteria bacterium CG12_big_fil_rev_8_21_14_0_65_55_1124]PIY52341.1 MAG: rhodanese-like domain-containing protein [Zetaproteobacteria bacterium CG_4_10_14_0_8_um_filter_55_43]PIZ37120.1 MAG: rhodanese-like domain-containing protein [Zetaproteobacteria b